LAPGYWEMAEVLQAHLDGTALYGNDLEGADLQRWYDEEEHGFVGLATDQYANDDGDFEIGTKAFNRSHGSCLPRQHFATCLAIGCANGEDVVSLEADIGRIIAVEPSRHWWKDRIGNVPAEYRAPTLEGLLDLPDGSVDLVVALGALHHVAKVELLLNELGRVLRRGGWLLVREPINSMGDFRQLRPGLTRNERGIPPQLMTRFIAGAQLDLVAAKPCSFQAINRFVQLFGRSTAYDSPMLVRLDAVVSKLTLFNARYWRPRLVDKFAPTSMVYVARKPD
jgi:SAM-dependent methyltransferase